MGEIAGIRNGGTPRTTVPEYWDGDIPWCTPTDITAARGRHLVATARSVTQMGLSHSGAVLLPKSALLLCTRATIGEVAAMPVATNQGFKSLLCGESVDHRYLYYCLLMLKARMVDLATGSTFLEISKRDLANIRVPLPPLPEQRAIAAVLSDIDELLESLEALISKKRVIKQAAMQALLTGRARLPGFGGEWARKRIGELADVNPENLAGSTPPDFSFNYVSIDDVHAGRLAGYTEESFQTAPSRARRVVRAGDILMSTVRPTLRGHLLFSDQLSNAVCSTGFAVLRSKRDRCEPHFLFAHLFGDVLDAQLSGLLAGSNYPAVSGSDVRGLQVTCPPTLREQQAIAAILFDMDADITALEHRLDKTRAIKQGMMQQLLTGAIRLPVPDTAPHENAEP